METTKKVYQAYSQELDMTTIFEDTFIGVQLISTEVKGFYFGEADDEGMKEYYGKLKADFQTD